MGGLRKRLHELAAQEVALSGDSFVSAEFAGAAITIARRSMTKEKFMSGLDAVWDTYELLFDEPDEEAEAPAEISGLN